MEKRRDSKGRVLKTGESQRPDGKYEYKYMDNAGNRRSVYSWKLVGTDKLPEGKRDKQPLRDIEKSLLRDMNDGIDSYTAQKTTINDLFKTYIDTRYSLKWTTKIKYQHEYQRYVYNSIGLQKISQIKYSDIKKFYIHLIKDANLKVASVRRIHGMLHPMFSIAVRDEMIRMNPTDGIFAELKETFPDDAMTRHPLTMSQQDRFIKYIRSKRKYESLVPLLITLLGTGCRIGEALGLRWEDCDFNSHVIDINHTLVYVVNEEGHCQFYVTTPKTKAGIRTIPMLNDVYLVLKQEYERQEKVGFCESEVDGYTNFVFHSRRDRPLTYRQVDRSIERIIKNANDEEKILSTKENREPVLLPHFTCHHLRHTFCTRMCENETNLKVIQEIMGHSNIQITMNVYNEATKDKKAESFEELEGKIRLS